MTTPCRIALVLLALLLPGYATQASDPVEIQLPLVTNVQAPAGEPTLKDHFDGTLGTINGFIFGTLFRDVSFGAFQNELYIDWCLF